MRARRPKHAVLIIDVVHSTALADRLRPALLSRLRSLSRLHLAARRIRLPYVVTAGDEFQTLASAPGQVPVLIFELRRLFRPLVLRIGVGIGGIAGRVRAPVNLLSGEAFILARSALESVHDSTSHRFEVLTGLRANTPGFDTIANTIYGLHDTLVQNISEKQWQTINAYLKTKRVDLTARSLGVNLSTVSRNLKRGYLRQLEETVATMTEFMNQSFPDCT
jgi:hypothetical protein